MVSGGELLSDLGQVVCLPELQIGATLQEFADTCRLLHTRQLDEDTTSRLEALDVGRHDAEAVDTCAQYIK